MTALSTRPPAAPTAAGAGLAAALVANVIWSGNYVFTRDAIADFGPILFACFGSAITALILTAGLLVTRTWRGSWRDARWVLAGGVVGLAVNWASYAVAQANAPVSHTAFLISMTPLFLIPLTALLDRTPVPRTVLGGAALATIGVWILVSQYQDDGVYPNVLLGDAFALLAAASYALFAWLLGRGMRTFSPITAVCVAQYSTVPTLTLVGLITGAWSLNFAALTGGDWLHLAVVQALGGAAAPGLFFVAISVLGTVRAGMVLYLQPVLGALFGVVLLGEQIGASTLLGGGLILGAVILSQLGGRRNQQET